VSLYWTTRDGQRVRPEKMTFEHRQATIKMVMRNAKAEASKLADESWGHTGDTDLTLQATDFDDLANNDSYLFAEIIKHRPVIRRMAELNELIKGEANV
jgi:hypothetical protein